MNAHTPGPWSLLPQNGAGPMVVQEFVTGKQRTPIGYRLIAHMLQRGDSLKQDQANARLIAAAPELLEALTMVRDADNDCIEDDLPHIPTSARETIDAALAKAAA